MDGPRLVRQLVGAVMVLLFLAGCVTPTAAPILFSTPTAVPPTATPAPTPPLVLGPGGQIGQMTVEISSRSVPNWLDHCTPSFSDKPGGATVDCRMPLFPEFEIGAAWSARDQALLESSWKALTWELYVDDQAIDLQAFGTSDFDWLIEGGLARFRSWNLKLVNANAGKHTLRYRFHADQEVDDGLTVTQPGTYQAVVNLELVPQTATPTAMPAPAATVASTPLPAQESWWHHAVFYELFVRSFADSTAGPLAGDGIGDLQGLIEKLDYLNDGDPATSDDLGVTGLWLMPIMQSPSYHGYDITDYYTVHKDYGTNEDFRRLLAEAHQRGMRIVIDLVLNHTSSEHPWFVEARDTPGSARRNWYIWSADKPAYRGPWGQEVWHFSLSGYYYGIFWSGMPDLNYENPQVSEEMERMTLFWLKDIGVDGFRLDGARHLIEEGSIQENTAATHEWWKRFRATYKVSNPQALTVGEVWSGSSVVATYLQGDEFDLAFDFDLASAVVNGVMARNAAPIRAALTSSYALFGSGRSATFLTNHDMNRVMTQLGGDDGKARLAAAVLIAAPGVPFLYYGEEIGMTGGKPDEQIRTPMQWSAEEWAGFTTGFPWEPVNGDYRQRNVAVQATDPASLLSCYRDLIHLRAAHPALQVGDYAPVDGGNGALLAFLRTSREDRVLVVMNLSQATVAEYALTLQAGPLTGAYQAAPLYGGEGKLPDLDANDTGGFDPYRPLPTIAGGATIIIQLQPQ